MNTFYAKLNALRFYCCLEVALVSASHVVVPIRRPDITFSLHIDYDVLVGKCW
jgi:hypothetical protein